MKYKISVRWEVVATMEVMADTIEQAVQQALNSELPDGQYVVDSFRVESADPA